MRKYLNIGAVLLLLIGFPTASYYYMKDGWNYRVRAIEAQGDFGKMPSLQELAPLRGELPEKLRGSMLVVGWLDKDNPSSTVSYGQTLDSLFQQFYASPNLYFTTITNGDAAFVDSFADSYELPEDDMLSFLHSDKPLKVSGESFQLPAEAGLEPLVALVDSSLTIRKHYNLSKRDETIGLVQLISLIIPLPEKADIIRAPEKEL